MLPIRILVVLVMLLASSLADEFNIFKSYANSPRKPPQYGRMMKREHRDINEYLTGRQKGMMKYRHGKDVPEAMFSDKWSGFDLKANSKGVLRRLTAITSSMMDSGKTLENQDESIDSESVEDISNNGSYYNCGGVSPALVIAGVGITVGIYLYSRKVKDSIPSASAEIKKENYIDLDKFNTATGAVEMA